MEPYDIVEAWNKYFLPDTNEVAKALHGKPKDLLFNEFVEKINNLKVTNEERRIAETIISARKIQNFLWGEADGSFGLEEWRRMFIKRVHKISVVDCSQHHARVELKKRLLQNAALSIALLDILDRGNIKSSSDIPSNLPEYAHSELQDPVDSCRKCGSEKLIGDPLRCERCGLVQKIRFG